LLALSNAAWSHLNAMFRAFRVFRSSLFNLRRSSFISLVKRRLVALECHVSRVS